MNAERFTDAESPETTEQKNNNNAIAHQFSAICCEARARRMDISTTYKLIRNVCHIGRSKVGNDLCETRKTVIFFCVFNFI